MNWYSWIKIHTKCRREKDRYILSLSCFSCVYIIMFPPVALLLSWCSTLSSFIMFYIVIFICLQVSNNFYFPPLLICCKLPFIPFPICVGFFVPIFCSFLKGLCLPSPFCFLFLAPFLVYSFSQALFGISIQCEKIHDLWIKWNTTRESRVGSRCVRRGGIASNLPNSGRRRLEWGKESQNLIF